jgi:putative ABC transport system ATP-binding protein
VLTVLERVHHNGGTVVIVTHDPEIGARSQRRLRMLDGAIVSDDKD